MLKIALFLGAGASVSFGKPTTSQLKDTLLKKYTSQSFHNFILRSFLKVPEYTDIEYVLQSITELVESTEKIENKYFSMLSKERNSYNHTMMIHNGTSYTYDDFINEVRDVYVTLKKEVFTNYSWKHTNLEDSSLDAIYDFLFTIFGDTSDGVDIFTTNYDQAVEVYCARKQNLICIDGFQHDRGTSKTIWAGGDYGYYGKNESATNVRLYKLHGSLNWKEHTIHKFIKTDEETISDDPKIKENLVIYPTLSPKNGKNNEPYKTILSAFDQYMQKADVCVVIGFSFRDEHIKEIFERCYDKQKKIIVISPSAIKDFKINVLKEKPTENELKSWEQDNMSMNIRHQVYLIQKKLELGTVKQIVQEIKDAITSNERPIIPKGKSDRYYLCIGCGSNVSVQYTNCPNCNTPNPNPQIL